MLIAVAVVATGILPAPAVAHRAAACSAKGSKTVLASKYARIFRVVKEKPEAGVPGGERFPVDLLYGCLYRTNKRFFLGAKVEEVPGFFAYGDVHNVRLVGRYVGYSETFYGYHGDGSTRVRVTSLRSGRHRRALPSVLGPPPSDPCEPEPLPCDVWFGGPLTDVTALALKANGSVAWIGRQRGGLRDGRRYTQYEVRKADRAAKNIPLDSGVDIDPESLTLNRYKRTISWTNGGLTKSAPLK